MSTSNTTPGMNGLPFAPFPFLNPWNWGAMTPLHSAQAALVIMRANLQAWRAAVDAIQTTVRHQEDAALDAIEANLEHGANEPVEPPARPARSR
ncbi:MAG: hypothetical protein ABUS57_12325 [Pseudomonadota bacterium]